MAFTSGKRTFPEVPKQERGGAYPERVRSTSRFRLALRQPALVRGQDSRGFVLG